MSLKILATSQPSHEQLKQVIAIQEELSIARDLIKKGATQTQSGALVSALTLEELEQLSSSGKLFLASHSSQLVGYLIATDSHDLAHYLEAASPKVVLPQDGPLVYLNQIGVSFAAPVKGIGSALLSAFHQHFVGHHAYALVMKAPIDNIRSRRFFELNKYYGQHELRWERYRSVAGFQATLFEKQL